MSVGADRMLERFVRLCETASPTGSEREVADAVIAELQGLGLEVVEDGAASAARAGAGNLIVRVPGMGEGWVMFCAHLDTVPHAAPIEVDLVDGVYRSRGQTILGADNKAAVAVLVELAARCAGTTAEHAGSSSCSPWPRKRDCAELTSSISVRCEHLSGSCSTTRRRSAR